MSMYSGATTEERWGGRRCGRGPGWRPLEILAMVLGFILFWPIGVAILVFKIWQKRTGYQGDMITMAQDGWASVRSGDWSRGPWARGWGCGSRARREGGASGGAFRMRPTGNSAFDSWRDAELARLEEERRKLETAEREFSDYIENLRRAKDREEFDRFMRERGASSQQSPSGEQGPNNS